MHGNAHRCGGLPPSAFSRLLKGDMSFLLPVCMPEDPAVACSQASHGYHDSPSFKAAWSIAAFSTVTEALAVAVYLLHLGCHSHPACSQLQWMEHKHRPPPVTDPPGSQRQTEYMSTVPLSPNSQRWKGYKTKHHQKSTMLHQAPAVDCAGDDAHQAPSSALSKH